MNIGARSLLHDLTLKALRVFLLLAGVAFMGCSTRKTAGEWVEEYRRHVDLVKQTATEQQEVLADASTGSCVIPGIILWPYMSGPWITRVNPTIVKADVRAGDRIIAVNGKYVKHLGVLLLRLSRLRKGEPLELTLERNHELHRVKVRCGDSTAVFKTAAAVLEAAAGGDWQQCLQLADALTSITQVHYSWAAELRYNCNEADRLRARRPPNALDASLAHQWARLRLEEAKEIPEGIGHVQWSVAEIIAWLEQHRFNHLATDLSDHLDAYSPHLW